ncbi:MAG: hypothetical protein KatS3mg102_0574 [Planctomycetota bacterium]|nr:MAG: hypothetical protein KatS3mg102_0574 [Planctomycetota bacterium]
MIGLALNAGRAIWVRAAGPPGQPVLERAAIVPWTGQEQAEPVEGASERTAEAILDPASASALGAALRVALGPRELRRGEARVGIPGRDAILRYLHLPVVPAWRLRLLMEAEIEEVAEKVGEPLSADFRLLSLPAEQRAPGAEGLAVMVALAKEAPLRERIAALAGAGLRVGGLLPNPIALFDAWVGLGHLEPGRTVLLVDAGPEAVEMAIAREGFLLFARTLPGLPGTGEREVRQLAAALGSSLHFARDQQRLRELAVDEIRLSGVYARRRELAEAIQAALKAPLALFDPLERLEPAGELALADLRAHGLEQRGPELVLALGLALADRHPRALWLELLPRELQRRREFRRRTAWLLAGGAALGTALLLALGGAVLERGRAAERLAELRRVRAELQARHDALQALSAANRERLASLDALAARTAAGAATLQLLEALGELTPPAVTIERLALEQPSAASPAAGGVFRTAAQPGSGAAAAGETAGSAAALREGVPFVLEGIIDDVAGQAGAVLAGFEAALAADPRIAAARVRGTPESRPGALLAFTLRVQVRPLPEARTP